VENRPHSDNERPGWGGYIAAIVVSALGHAGLLAFALLVLPNWLHSETVDNPSMTVKIVDNIPAGDLGTHLPKLAGHNKPPPPEQVAKAEVKPETPPETPPPPEQPPPPPPKVEDDKNAVSLNKTGPTETPTPEPPPAVIPATPEPTATETPKKIAEPEPTPPPPEPKPRHHEKVIVHSPPKAKTPVQLAKADKTPDVHEQFRKLQQQLLKNRIAEAKKREADADNPDADSDDSDMNSADSDSADSGPVASNSNTAGKGYGVGAGTGSMGNLEDPEYVLYFRIVQQRVKDAWTFPGGSNDLKAELEFSIGADGSLNSVKITKGSGDSAFDDSVMRAIKRAAPFPPPPDKYRAQFSDIDTTFNLGELKS
jgi:protein TonB